MLTTPGAVRAEGFGVQLQRQPVEELRVITGCLLYLSRKRHPYMTFHCCSISVLLVMQRQPILMPTSSDIDILSSRSTRYALWLQAEARKDLMYPQCKAICVSFRRLGLMMWRNMHSKLKNGKRVGVGWDRLDGLQGMYVSSLFKKLFLIYFSTTTTWFTLINLTCYLNITIVCD